MLRLILLRHAKAEGLAAGTRDHERKLDDRGRGEAALMGAYLAKHALTPKLVLVSSAARTLETWAGIAAALAGKPNAVTDQRLYEAAPPHHLSILNELPGDEGPVLVIGHNPGLHDLAIVLIASGDAQIRERLREGLPPGGLVVIDFAAANWAAVHPRGGRLERFVTPRSLAAATD